MRAPSTNEEGSTFPRRILTIDGGGLKGAMPAAFLAEVEQISGQRIVDNFDLIAGTSTGGIIALGLAAGLSATEILDFYLTRGPRIFDQEPGDGFLATTKAAMRRFVRSARQLRTAKYEASALRSELAAVFGERRIGDSLTRIVIPAYDSANGGLYVFKTAHHERFAADWRVPVPQQKPAELKTTRLLTVQLLKRFRDIRCDARDYDRMPSVLLSKIAAEAPQGHGLLADLRAAASYMAPIVARSLDVPNPACPEDLLSDRWPKKVSSQRMLYEDLNDLVSKLDELLQEGTQVEKKQIIRSLFGENAAAEGYRRAGERASAKSREGTFAIAAGGGVAGTSASAKQVVAPTHRFYGD